MIIVHVVRRLSNNFAEGVVEAQTHPEGTALDLSDVLQALADPVRRSIVERLAREGEVPCGGFDLAVTKSTRTYHFRVLREAGLIEQREEGNRKLNTLRRDDVDARFPGLLEAVLGE
jgi:DNA-binding transcriptional ArsR family regulator